MQIRDFDLSQINSTYPAGQLQNAECMQPVTFDRRIQGWYSGDFLLSAVGNDGSTEA